MYEGKITETLTGLVDEFLARTSFFPVWNRGAGDKRVSPAFLLSFDSLVRSFPSLIAAGAARALDEKTRAVLAVNLYQECGEGDIRRTHHAIYRKYLATAGLEPAAENEADFAARWRVDLLKYIQGVPSPLAALGALAAGEFLAQPVLSRIFPLLQDQYPGADQEYFTKHLDLETEHVREITELLAGQIHGETGWAEVLGGFQFGLSVWETYFEGLAEYLEQAKEPIHHQDTKAPRKT